jgi:hypothetical protein
MVTHGCIANLDIPEATIPNATFKQAFELGRRVSPNFARTRPIRWAAIHFPEAARDALAHDESRQWKEVLYPLYGAYHTLLRARLPVGIVTDSQLEEGCVGGYRVLFLPTPERLTPRMRWVLQAAPKNNLQIVKQRESWQWHEVDDGLRHAASEFMAEIQPAMDTVPVRVIGGPAKMHAVYFWHRWLDRTTIALTNDFAWVYTGHTPEPDKIAELTEPPQPCQDVAILIRRKKPRRIIESVSGATLTAESHPQGWVVQVPDFEHMAVVVVEY